MGVGGDLVSVVVRYRGGYRYGVYALSGVVALLNGGAHFVVDGSLGCAH